MSEQENTIENEDKLEFLKNRENIKKQINFENYFDDEEEALFLEEKALANPPQLDIDSLPSKQYLDKTVIPHIYQAMKALLVEKPRDPIEFFAYYLILNNPYSKDKEVPSQQQSQEPLNES